MTYEELDQASRLAVKRINAKPASEEHWRLAAKQWRKSGFIVPCQRKYQPR